MNLMNSPPKYNEDIGAGELEQTTLIFLDVDY